MSTPEPPFTRELGLLASAELGVLGRVTESTNLTLVVEFGQGDDYAWGIYKPEAGERPLHDFDPGLHARELAAFELSEWLGWHLVPPTVVRHDAPVGVGSVQWFVENDGEHYFTLLEQRPETHDQLRRMALFDVITNNTDRKGGHVLCDADGHLWGIDHGLCFGTHARLRTVIWDFAGEAIAPALLGEDLTVGPYTTVAGTRLPAARWAIAAAPAGASGGPEGFWVTGRRPPPPPRGR